MVNCIQLSALAFKANLRRYNMAGVCDRLVAFGSAVEYNQFEFEGCFDATSGASAGFAEYFDICQEIHQQQDVILRGCEDGPLVTRDQGSQGSTGVHGAGSTLFGTHTVPVNSADRGGIVLVDRHALLRHSIGVKTENKSDSLYSLSKDFTKLLSTCDVKFAFVDREELVRTASYQYGETRKRVSALDQKLQLIESLRGGNFCGHQFQGLVAELDSLETARYADMKNNDDDLKHALQSDRDSARAKSEHAIKVVLRHPNLSAHLWNAPNCMHTLRLGFCGTEHGCVGCVLQVARGALRHFAESNQGSFVGCLLDQHDHRQIDKTKLRRAIQEDCAAFSQHQLQQSRNNSAAGPSSWLWGATSSCVVPSVSVMDNKFACHGQHLPLLEHANTAIPTLVAFANAMVDVVHGELALDADTRVTSLREQRVCRIFDDGQNESHESMLSGSIRHSFMSRFPFFGNSGEERKDAIRARCVSRMSAGEYKPTSKPLLAHCFKRLNLLCQRAAAALCGNVVDREQQLRSRHSQAREDILTSADSRRESVVDRICLELEQMSEDDATRPTCLITGFNRVHRNRSYYGSMGRGGIDYQLGYTRMDDAEHVPHDLFFFRNRVGGTDFAQQVSRRFTGGCALQPNQRLISVHVVKNMLVSFVSEAEGAGVTRVCVNSLHDRELWSKGNVVKTFNLVIDMVEFDPATLMLALYSSQDGGRISRYRIDENTQKGLTLECVGSVFILDGSVWNLGFDRLRAMKFVHHRDELLLFGENDSMRVVDLRSDKLKPAKQGWFTLDQAGMHFPRFLCMHLDALCAFLLFLWDRVPHALRLNMSCDWSTLGEGRFRQSSGVAGRHLPVRLLGHEREAAAALLHQRRGLRR